MIERQCERLVKAARENDVAKSQKLSRILLVKNEQLHIRFLCLRSATVRRGYHQDRGECEGYRGVLGKT
jgi:hypothetical protein